MKKQPKKRSVTKQTKDSPCVKVTRQPTIKAFELALKLVVECHDKPELIQGALLKACDVYRTLDASSAPVSSAWSVSCVAPPNWWAGT